MPPYVHQDGSERAGRLELRTTLVVLFVALIVNFLPQDLQLATAERLRGTVLLPFLALQEGLVDAQARAEEASVLQARIDSLTAVVMGRTTLEEENRRLRGLLQLDARDGWQWQAVKVLRAGQPDQEGTLMVDAGLLQRVREGAPLVTREGLAGVIIEPSPGMSTGIDWTHPDFRASAMTLDGLHYGIVRSDAGIFRETRLLLEGLPYSAVLDSGTVVVTSGMGTVIPRGLPIGRVLEDAGAEGEWRKTYWLQPFVEARSLTLGLVGLEGGIPQEDDLSDWQEGGFLRAEERAAREEALADTLRMLRDSLALLRGAGRGGVEGIR